VDRVFLYALLAALNPTLLTATTVMLLLPSPKRLMLGYLAGALTTGVVVGIAVVEWLSDSGTVSETKNTLAPGVDLALGLLFLIAAWVVRSGQSEEKRARREEKKANKTKEPPRWQKALQGGSPRTTFLVGLLLSFPGASYLASLTEISRQNLSTGGVVLTVLAANAVMLILLELPLISFTVAPEWTPRAVDRFKGWMAENGAHVLVRALAVIGLLLITRAVVTVLA